MNSSPFHFFFVSFRRSSGVRLEAAGLMPGMRCMADRTQAGSTSAQGLRRPCKPNCVGQCSHSAPSATPSDVVRLVCVVRGAAFAGAVSGGLPHADNGRSHSQACRAAGRCTARRSAAIAVAVAIAISESASGVYTNIWRLRMVQHVACAARAWVDARFQPAVDTVQNHSQDVAIGCLGCEPCVRGH